ncbi:hypothetical protein [Saccharospirillum sp.]|uniref:hypothetical protein n=1 Tax=Saccharospirillum sp. TaxID=2033801 RepID=UPI0034A01E17
MSTNFTTQAIPDVPTVGKQARILMSRPGSVNSFCGFAAILFAEKREAKQAVGPEAQPLIPLL